MACAAGAGASRWPRRAGGFPSAWAIAGDASHSSARGTTAASSGSVGAPPERTKRASAPIPTATATAGPIVAHAARDESDTVRSATDAVCHSSRWRRVTNRRQRVRAMASAESQAWCGRKASASPTCRALVARSRSTAA